MINEQLIEIRRQFHQIPEIGLEEVKTQQLLLKIIAMIDKPYVEIKTWQTGILVFVHGESPEKQLVGGQILMVYQLKKK